MLVSTKPGLSQRQQLILEFIRDHGSVQVDELSAHLNVTPQTIRRDLNQLYDLNIGTTNERVAEYLYKRRGLLVITNNINVAKTLWPAPGIEVMITGGTVRQADGGIVGSMTEKFINSEKIVWQPTTAHIQRSHLKAFMEKHNIGSLQKLFCRPRWH